MVDWHFNLLYYVLQYKLKYTYTCIMFIDFDQIVVGIFLIINCVSCSPPFEKKINTIIHEVNTKPKISWKVRHFNSG